MAAGSSSSSSSSSSSKKAGGFFHEVKKVYLISYNLTQFGLWAAVAFYVVKALLTDPRDYAAVWAAAGPVAKMAVGGAWLELLHVLLGLAGGSVSSAFWQNFGRWFVLFNIVNAFNTGKQSIWLPSLLLAWSAGEMIRYPFYLLGSSAPGPLVWLRYSAFLLLYPWGMASEIALLVLTVPEAKAAVAKTDKFCLRVQGQDWRLFNFHYFLIFGLAVLYPLAIPYMYTYMLKQRKKRLSGTNGKGGGAAATGAAASKKSRKAE